MIYGTVHYLSLGGPGGNRAEDFGLNKVKFTLSPLWMLLHCSDPPITFDDFRDLPPHPMSSFSKQKWVIPPPNPSKVFIDSPLLGSQLRLIPPFVLLKIKWSPPGINNDRSLIHFMNRIAPFDFEHAKVHLILLANPEVMGWNKRCLT